MHATVRRSRGIDPLPVRNLRELVDYARKIQASFNFGSWSPGSTGQLNGALLKELAGSISARPVHREVPIWWQAMASGDVQMAFDRADYGEDPGESLER